ncbi:MAG TPA: VWA domain-containing protein [Vicinamibacterales bacterium]|nr:VWA domain-containing protein [Vicinamibacterales bacterium]
MRSRSLLLMVFVMATSVAAQQPPRFQTTVDVTSVVDVAVVDESGRPITGLGASDFNVWIDGEARRVLNAEWVAVVDNAKEQADGVIVPEGFSSNENFGGGRLIVIAVDQPGIRFGGSTQMMRTLTSFIDKLLPSDRIAVVGFGPGAPTLSFTSDLNKAKQVVSRMTGGKQPGAPTTYSLGLGESLSILRGELGMLDGAVARECANMAPRSYQLSVCSTGVKDDAHQIAREALEQANTTITGLNDLLISLREIDAPKTVVLISEGFVVNDYEAFADQAGVLAAAAKASLYVLHLNEASFDSNSGRRPPSAIEDRRIGVLGLEAMAKVARGDMFTINGAGTGVFDRIHAEISGHYLIGIEPDRRDYDGKAHSIRIEVPWNGAIVRARRKLLNVAPPVDRRSPSERVAAGLKSPLPLATLPLRVATFALQGPETGKVQMLVHADVGRDFSGPRRMAVGYSILDESGQEVEGRRLDSRLTPAMNGVPSALQFAAGASLLPGTYTLRLAAADGDRIGSVEHHFTAGLAQLNGVTLSDLIAGGPTTVREFLSPTVGYTVSFGSVHGYMEAYGDQVDAVTVKYEIASAANSAALIETDVPGRLFGDDRMIFTRVIPVRELPPGRYVLRAKVSVAARPLETLTRPFEVAAYARSEALAGVAEPPADPAESDATTDLFLPVDEQLFAGAFERDRALTPEVLQPFRDRLAPEARQAFERGVSALTAGDYKQAETSFKSAVQPELDSTSALAYLAVVYASAGNEAQAVGAWQTALINGDDIPHLFAWLSHSLLRSHSLGQAQGILEEANEKWPGDPRFTGALASVYATFGRGQDAVRLLELYLEKVRDDREAALVGVEWLYQIQLAGRVVHSREEDLNLARTWAVRYGDGPRAALVKQWLDVMERQ